MIPSPCVGVCAMDEKHGLCKGCLRSLDEIKEWPRMSDPERQDVLEKLEELKKQYKGQAWYLGGYD